MGAPLATLAKVKKEDGVHFLPLDQESLQNHDLRDLFANYLPAEITHQNYPNLIAEGTSVPTIANRALLVAYTWPENSPRYKRVAKFVDAFFSKFDELQKPPRHPKWREVNFAATLEGWHRSPAAQAWINRAKQGTSTASKSNFDTFLAQNAGSNDAPVSDEQRAELFKAFLEWNKSQH